MEMLGVIMIAVIVVLFANLKKGRDQARNSESANAPSEISSLAVATSGDITTADLCDQTKEEVKSESNDMENNVTKEKKGTRDLFLETLTKIGCQYEIGDGENGDINFGYQGEYFVVRASNEARYIQIYDTHWGHVELYDIDEFSRLKKAINESNLRNSVTAVYTIDEAGNNVNVHCKSVIPFIPEIPDIADYLRIELNEYFRVHETINMEMAKQREQESEK